MTFSKKLFSRKIFPRENDSTGSHSDIGMGSDRWLGSLKYSIKIRKINQSRIFYSTKKHSLLPESNCPCSYQDQQGQSSWPIFEIPYVIQPSASFLWTHFCTINVSNFPNERINFEKHSNKSEVLV